MKKHKILVIGDSALDVTYLCDTFRLEPAAPVPILEVKTRIENPGMAGNVAQNLKYLGANVDFITNKNWKSITKTRLYDDKTNHFFLRFDNLEEIERIKNLRKINFKKYDAIVVSDYHKNFLTEDDLKFIGKSHKLTIIDTKRKLAEWSKNFTFIKINRAEYKSSEKQIIENNLQDQIIQTLGEEGIKYRNIIYPVQKVDIRNLIGAGDVIISAFIVKYLETQSIPESIKFANEKATLAVQKRKIGLCE
jgi:bifunctional ADP-heptose synthase (sugar kinase/adenylyltransferase)